LMKTGMLHVCTVHIFKLAHNNIRIQWNFTGQII